MASKLRLTMLAGGGKMCELASRTQLTEVNTKWSLYTWCTRAMLFNCG